MWDTLATTALTIAINTGYHERPTQFLPREDAALVVWGEKITGDISHTVRFYASREEARKYLQTRKVNCWLAESFTEVDWEHLDLALAQKPDLYKIWRSKQNSGFCGTRVQVGRYSGHAHPDEQCPNCGGQETAAYLMLCPNNGRSKLLIKNTDELSKWLEKKNMTDPELAYWIPKYILMRGNKPFSELGAMSAKMPALAKSQDIIEWHNFTEGHISTHFYEIRQFHLVMHSSYLSGADWTKQFISRILHITHSQWIFRNISLHDKSFGYIQNKQLGDITRKIDKLADATSESIPPESQFLLDINFLASSSNLEAKSYWILAMKAALIAKKHDDSLGLRSKKARKQASSKIPSRKKLDITEVERQIRADKQHLPDQDQGSLDEDHPTLARLVKSKQPHPSSLMAQLKSNKCQRKPD